MVKGQLRKPIGHGDAAQAAGLIGNESEAILPVVSALVRDLANPAASP
jgi:hypothetical protein